MDNKISGKHLLYANPHITSLKKIYILITLSFNQSNASFYPWAAFHSGLLFIFGTQDGRH